MGGPMGEDAIRRTALYGAVEQQTAYWDSGSSGTHRSTGSLPHQRIPGKPRIDRIDHATFRSDHL